MADHIPFVTGVEASKIVGQIYSDSEFVRIPLEKCQTFSANLPKSLKLWIDTGLEGLDNLETRRSTEEQRKPWYEFITSFPHLDQIGEPSSWEQPDTMKVEQLVTALLNKCIDCNPAWITVPQLPLVNDSSRNKINRALSKATGKWKSKTNFSGRLILPLIFTHQDQVNGKVERNPKVKHAGRCYHDAQADGFWVVDKSLQDDSGSKTLRNTRIPALVSLHQELNEEIPSKIRIAGPYWGTNLLLWARGLVDFPAIGIGNTYQYFLAGGHANTPSVQLAIEPLRRRVGLPQLKQWLDDSIQKLGGSHPASAELGSLRKQLPFLSAQDLAREQVAKFYKKWFDLLSATPRPGRSLALFQDLSMAYALGRSLPTFSPDEGTARRPESVVEPFMLNCI